MILFWHVCQNDLFCKTVILRSLYSHVFKCSKVNWAPTNQKLNIPQLTLVKLAQSIRHESVHIRGRRVLGSQVQSPLGVPFYWNHFALPYIRNTRMRTLPTFSIYAKTRLSHLLVSVAFYFHWNKKLFPASSSAEKEWYLIFKELTINPPQSQ